MGVAEEITSILNKKLSPSHLKVVNESYLHKGHAGDDGTGESHFRIAISSEAFDGKSRVECHRMVYDALDLLVKERIHALAIDIQRP